MGNMVPQWLALLPHTPTPPPRKMQKIAKMNYS